jgi:hypothetical protein
MINPRIVEGNKLKAIEFSKDWYEIVEKGKKKKVYLNVFFNPTTAQIQIGEMQTDKEIFGSYVEIYSLWKCLSRQIVWNYGASTLFKLCEKLIETQADIDQLKLEIQKEDFTKKLKPRKEWIKFSGGSEK